MNDVAQILLIGFKNVVIHFHITKVFMSSVSKLDHDIHENFILQTSRCRDIHDIWLENLCHIFFADGFLVANSPLALIFKLNHKSFVCLVALWELSWICDIDIFQGLEMTMQSVFDSAHSLLCVQIAVCFPQASVKWSQECVQFSICHRFYGFKSRSGEFRIRSQTTYSILNLLFGV